MTHERITYISQRVWREIPSQIRKAILRTIGYKRTEIVSTTWYIASLEDALRRRGEHDLANALMADDPMGHFEQHLLSSGDEQE